MADQSRPTPSPAQPFSTRTLHLFLLLLVGSLLLFVGLGDIGLTDRDEGSNAEAGREMLESGDWISPTLNYEPRYAKPAFVYWVLASTYALFGENEFTARLPSAMFGLGLLFLQYFFLNRFLGPTIAFGGALILLLNAEFVGLHRMVMTDPELVFFTTLATYSFWVGFREDGRDRHFLWLFYIGMALAMLAKGPVGIIIPLLAVIPYLTLTRQWKIYFAKGKPLVGWMLFIAIAAPWYLAMFAIHGADYAAAAHANTTGRFANPMEGHGGTLFFYLPVLLVGFFPWSGFLPVTVYQSLKEWKLFRSGEKNPKGEEGLLLFSTLWILGILVFFTISATRLPHYILPLFPAASLLVAVFWSRCLSEKSPSGLKLSVRIILVTGYLLSIVLVSLPAIYEYFQQKIALEFPVAQTVEVGITPLVLGAGVFVSVVLFRHFVWHDTKRPQAFWIMSGAIVVLLLIVLVFTLPHYGKYFISPPQELATLAGETLGPNDALVQFGRKRPSLAFYAKRKVYFISPGEDELFTPHVKSKGHLMVILQSNRQPRLPHPISQFKPVQQQDGWVLLSSETLVR
ncbi:MAG: glycosyltransferase family 39 protein [Nitrospirae bacterium]|nr:glycosyltransferase family 39 protein [Nitrospirota bacterium]MDA1303838.1 glycosyltransferase family 39 protein [Nitrospirota bacterium]